MDNMANSNEFLEVDLDSVDSVADLSESITGQLLIGNPVVIAFGEVYALICDTYNEEAVNKVRGIKNRGDLGKVIYKAILNPNKYDWQKYKPEEPTGSRIE